MIRAQHDLAKAVKADDAAVPVFLWDERIMRRTMSAVERTAITTLRQFALQVYRHRLLQDCGAYLMALHGSVWLSGSSSVRLVEKVQRDIGAMRETMWRAANNDWFEYPT